MDNNSMKIRESFIYAVRAEIPSDYEIVFEPVVMEPAMRAGDFTIVRLVVDFRFQPQEPIKFDTSASLRVYFTHEEHRQHENLEPRKWNGTTWDEVTHNRKLLDYHLWAGYFEIEITGPNDPSIALGE